MKCSENQCECGRPGEVLRVERLHASSKDNSNRAYHFNCASIPDTGFYDALRFPFIEERSGYPRRHPVHAENNNGESLEAPTDREENERDVANRELVAICDRQREDYGK